MYKLKYKNTNTNRVTNTTCQTAPLHCFPSSPPLPSGSSATSSLSSSSSSSPSSWLHKLKYNPNTMVTGIYDLACTALTLGSQSLSGLLLVASSPLKAPPWRKAPKSSLYFHCYCCHCAAPTMSNNELTHSHINNSQQHSLLLFSMFSDGLLLLFLYPSFSAHFTFSL